MKERVDVQQKKKMRRMRGLDLFSGIGVASLAMEAAGIEVVGHSEIEPFPCAVLEERFPGVPNYGDVTKFDEWPWDEIGHIDVVCSGSPCQDLSIAGKRAGLSGERSGLFYDSLGAFRRSGARYFVWENVVGAMSSNKGRDFASVLDALADIGALDISWRVLDAQGFGVPQRRRRVFLVADFAGECAREILFEREGESRDLEAGGEARQEAASDPESRLRAGGVVAFDWQAGGGGSDDSFKGKSRSWIVKQGDYTGSLSQTKVQALAYGHGLSGEVAAPLTSRYHKGVNSSMDDGAVVVEGGVKEAWGLKQGQTGSNGRGVKKNATHSLDGSSPPAIAFSGGNSAKSRSMGEAEEVSPPLKSVESGTNQVPTVAHGIGGSDVGYSPRANPSASPLSPDGGVNTTTVTQSEPKGGGEAMRVRKLTPVECERLQGLPDGWTNVPYGRRNAEEVYYRPDDLRDDPKLRQYAVGVVADTPRYRACGNAWCYPVGLFVMLGVAEALRSEDVQ